MIIKTPKVSEVKLGRHYAFMYEHFVLLTQEGSYLFLEKNDAAILALHFDSPYCKYSGPNDEAHGSHPLAQYGLGFYGLFEVEHSPWIEEMRVANRIHPSHSDSMFSGYRHYIACFKDIKFESVCHNMKEVVLTKGDVAALVTAELRKLES